MANTSAMQQHIPLASCSAGARPKTQQQKSNSFNETYLETFLKKKKERKKRQEKVP